MQLFRGEFDYSSQLLRATDIALAVDDVFDVISKMIETWFVYFWNVFNNTITIISTTRCIAHFKAVTTLEF